MNDIQRAKQDLRTAMKEQREQLSESDAKAGAESICSQLIELIAKRNARVLHTFLPLPGELDVWPVIHHALANDVTVVTTKTLPKAQLQHLILSDPNDLEDGRFGTKHPRNGMEYNGDYDLVIVPGLVFDSNGGRIGYGAGYYDGFMKDHPEALKVGVCYGFQVVGEVPQEGHDVGVDFVLTTAPWISQ